MTVRYGPLLASFIEQNDPTHTIISSGGTLSLSGFTQAEVRRVLGQMNRGRFTLLKSAGWNAFVQEGRIVSLYQENKVLGEANRGMLHREMGSFLIQSVKEKLGKDGRLYVEVRGLGQEHRLTKELHWRAVGAETIYSGALTEATRDPWATTLVVGVPHGNDSAGLDSDSHFEKGDEIRIQMDSGDWYVGRIRNPDPSGTPAGVIQMDPRIPGDARVGNAVEGRKAVLRLSNLTGMAAGQRVEVALDAGGRFVTVIESVDLAEGAIWLRDGLPSKASVGKGVWAFDYSEPATNDVELIMAPVAGLGWSAQFGHPSWHGTARGTAHAPVGESVWDLLVAAGEQTGEFFRTAPLSGGFAPRQRIDWLREPDDSGMTLYLRRDSAEVAADGNDVDRGVVRSIEREREADVITRVYPLSGDGRIDLEYCSTEGLLRAAVEGFSVVVSTDLFTPDYVEYGPGRQRHGVLAGTFRFGNVSLPKKASLAELTTAADAMLAQAMATILESQRREYWRVECVTHRPLFPGQKVRLVNTVAAPTTSGEYYILEVTDRLEANGPIVTSLLLSAELSLRPTAVVKLGRELKAGQMEARRRSLVEEGTAATVVSGGGGTPGPHEHGEFLRVDGTRALVGNMAVGAGVTVDGVDISAHAADPAAHHAPVSAGDATMLVEGQGVRVNPAVAGAGLGMSGGVMGVNTGAAAGTWVDGSDRVAVLMEAAGGLEVGALGGRLKRPANSGLKVGAAGTEIVPGSVGARTANAVVGETHTHAGLAYADGKTNPGEILKTDVNGDARTRWFSADRLRAPILESESGPVVVDPFSGKLDVDGDLTLTGAGRAIRSATGQGLLLAPAGRLMVGPGDGVVELQAGTTLKTAHWASGFLGTGWGMTYPGALDCRSVTADEMIVQTFIADAARVRVGQLWVTPGAAMLAEAFVIPAVGGVGTMVVEDAPGLANWPVFDAGDWVLLQGIDRSGGGLKAGLMGWGQVSGYVDGPGEGQQSWTFTCRQTAMPGQRVGGGVEVLGFAKSGASWIQANATDAAGAPWLGMSFWRGDNPYTDGNRVHFLRLGQLRGVTGVWEAGLHVGQAGGRRLRWSELAAEIHGARMSLYAGDGAQARVVAADVRLYRDGTNYVTLTPNGDGVATNVVGSAGGGYWSLIDDSVDAPAAADWVANGLNSSGQLSVQLSDPAVWGAVYGVTVRAVIAGVGFSSDSVRVYGQVVAADEVTALTSEELLATLASNVTQSVTRTLRPDTAATQAMWNGARLRLRWDYAINSAKEAIRLDPQVPSIAVGMGLPTGPDTGGDGFWVGAEGGTYKLRLGRAVGVGIRWDGAALALRNSANQDVIVMRSDGTSEFARAMTLGPAGGIWQGTGTFDAPGTGLKLWRDGGGIGRLSSFNAGLEQMTLNSSGQLVAGAGGVVLDRTGLQFVNSLIESQPGHPSAVRFRSGPGSADYVNMHGYGGGLRLATVRPGSFDNELILSHGAGALGSNLYGMFTNGVELYVRDGAGGNGPLFMMQPGYVAALFNNNVGSFIVGGGLNVGGMLTTPHPGVGVIRLQARATGVNVPPSDVVTKTGELYLVNEAGVLKLYFRFSNGVVRALASSV